MAQFPPSAVCAYRSGCNAATAPSEKLEYESLDLFLQAIRATEKVVGKNVSFWKVGVLSWYVLVLTWGLLRQADIDSAFRRIPVKPLDREYGHTVFKYNENVVVASHLAMMFGSVASVHHWERVGEYNWLSPFGCVLA